MMFCRNCGKQMADQAVLCVSCGVLARKGSNHCQNCGAQTEGNAAVCVKCGVGLVGGVSGELKSKIAAGLLGIFLGGLGVHRFYLGYVGIGIAQIAVTLLTCGIGSIWGLIEGIMILTGSISQDAQGRPLKE